MYKKEGSKVAKKFKRSELLNIKVYGNPAPEFKLSVVQMQKNRPVIMQVTDVYGRVLETRRNIQLNELIRFGSNYKQGIYFARFIQGAQHQTIKLTKLN